MIGAMDLPDYLSSSDADAEMLIAAARRAGLAAVVPACPGWDVADLLRHVGGLARGLVPFLRTANPLPPTAAEISSWFADPPTDGELIDWYAERRAEVRKAFVDADPDGGYFTFLPAASPLLHWARRDAHETAIHRVDAELAAGRVPSAVPADFALDGIRELLVFVGVRHSRLVAPHATALAIRARDTGHAWTVRIGPVGWRVHPGADPDADCVVTATTERLYVALWNRADIRALDVIGDENVLDRWRTGVRWVL